MKTRITPLPKLGIAAAVMTLLTLTHSELRAANPSSGTLTSGNPVILYSDGPLIPNPTGVIGKPNCTAPDTCSQFDLTVNASSLAASRNITIVWNWTPVYVDFDFFIEDDTPQRNIIAANQSTADPSAIVLPVPADGTVYHIIVEASVGTTTFNGAIYLSEKFQTAAQGSGAAPRYINYPAGSGQANAAGEPSIGVDWNPNNAALRHDKVNTGGVAMFTTSQPANWRVNFDDCSSPAINLWENKSGKFTPTGLDSIGFVDHFSSQQMGTGPNPPHTPGRVFHIDLGAGDSAGSFSDDDGDSYLPGGNGGLPAGPDHETLGGGPYHAPLPAAGPIYPNAIYYCSQDGVQEAECSRSDDGGLTFGPGVPIYNLSQCGGGIHGHVKVSPQGTVYVPNSSCAVNSPSGVNGVAVSKDNGLTWNEFNVPGSTGSQDPAIGIAQNNIGKPIGQVPSTIYLGWISGDGHAHVAHSPNEGGVWQDDTDISSIFGIQNAVFPVVVAGDDNRAAYSFLGTDPDFTSPPVWHLYIATTYDGGKNWILVDATPNDPVQIGKVCLLGIACSGARNLLDFNGIDIDREGRVLVAYADGCVNCVNTQSTQSNAAHGTIARQSGGRRLFSAFDPVEPAQPGAPQVVSATRVTTPIPGVLITWLQPDNSGSPITGYNIYRSNSSGTESLYAHVDGADTNKYLDPNASSGLTWFYKVTAVNGAGESSSCSELSQ